MNVDQQNINFKLAFDFVNLTNSSLYLSGKAGTGKTTFLKYVKTHCRKNLVIVAPTGVAAINAGGVTMHSFFQLPFGPFLPEVKTGFGLNEGVVDQHALFKNLKLNSTKQKLIRELELLVIDEVSMLRSDTLDAINTVLKTMRKSRLPFGGVQVLFIGDLYQLPPVVRDNEKQLLDRYYESPYFFDAMVLKETSLINIELTKIYRQNDQPFIDLLNKLRHNILDQDDLEQLNSRYDPFVEKGPLNYITLTTHNHKAEVINKQELDKLPGREKQFRGTLKGDFGEKQLPTELTLTLKPGAQVMFVKNDSSPEKRYYNGKIGVVSGITDEEVYVRFPDENEDLEVKPETWENISYSLNQETRHIDEKVIGEFIQIPLRLAWAITIHKSQGLTFERAIIDAGQSFAPGQVYVALSRCTSLQGVVLLSRISGQSIVQDQRIVRFSAQHIPVEELSARLKQEAFAFEIRKLHQLFDFDELLLQIYALEEATLLSKLLPEQDEAIHLIRRIVQMAREQKKIAEKFILQIEALTHESQVTGNLAPLKDRVIQGIRYFVKSINEEIRQPLENFRESIRAVARIKKYLGLVQECGQAVWLKIAALQDASLSGEQLLPDHEKLQHKENPAPKKASGKGQSPRESLAYFLSGKPVAEVARLRNLAVSTIEKHLSDFVKTGELPITHFLRPEQVDEIGEAYHRSDEKTTTALRRLLQDAYSFTEIRMALYELGRQKRI